MMEILAVFMAISLAAGVYLIRDAKKLANRFALWCAERGLTPSMDAYIAFVKDTKGAVSLVDWVKGMIVLAILGVGVALPIVIQTVQNTNVSDPTTSLIIGFIPTIVAVVILLGFFGR